MASAASAAPDALTPPPGNPRFPLMDAMRAIAALSVVVTHAAGLTAFNSQNPLGAITARLNLGVTVFFLISGFLLYRPYVRAAFHRVEAPGVGRFFRRRALRILPAYWLALTVLAAWPGLAGVFTGDWYAYYGLAQVYSREWLLGGIGPAWSLCVEVSFYALLPFLALTMRRAYARDPRRGARTDLLVLGGLALASLVVRTLVHAHDELATFPNTLGGTFFWFALGMGMAVVSVACEGREDAIAPLRLIVRRPWVAWAAAAAVLAALSWGLDLPRSFPLRYTELAFIGEHVGFGLFSLLLLLPAVFGDWAGGWPRRILANRLLGWLGLVSYGIYLWHLPLMIWLDQHGAQSWVPSFPFVSLLLAAGALAIACAATSYYLVERPLLRFKDPRRPRPATRPAAATSAG